MMKNTIKICVLASLIAMLCISQTVSAGYIDCEVECLFAAFREPTLCNCINTLKLHWGKRAPRGGRTRKLPTFRYGKRSSPYINQGVQNDLESRLEALGSIRRALESESQSEYEV